MLTYLHKDGEKVGPFEDNQILTSLRNGSLSYDEWCWQDGWDDWRPLRSTFPEAASPLPITLAVTSLRPTTTGNAPSNPVVASRRTVSGFERFLFWVTRFFVLGGAVLVLVCVGILVFLLLAPSEGSNVSYSEVTGQTAAPSSSDSDASSSSADVPADQATIPADLKPYFLGDNQSTLQGWLANLNQDQQKDFLSNMVTIVREAKAHNQNPSDAINAYSKLKLKRLQQVDSDRYASLATKAAYVSSIFCLLIILSMLAMVLVMLAIERNTRPVEFLNS